MKQFLFKALVLAGLVAFTNANAQQGLSLSVKATPQFSFLQNKDDNDNSTYGSKATFNTAFGIGAGYNFTKNVGIGVDALYSMQGQHYTLNGTEFRQKVDYVKVPLYFTYNSDASKPVSFIGKVGPQVSFITRGRLTDKDNNQIGGSTKDKYETATFGGAALAGVQFKLSHDVYLSTAARFDYDFTNAEDDSYHAYPAGRAKTYNSTAGLEVGLKYMLR